MNLAFKEIVTIVIALMTMSFVPVYFSRKRKLSKEEDCCLEQLISKFIKFRNEKKSASNVIEYSFSENERVLAMEALKLCVSEEGFCLKNNGHGAHLDEDVGVTLGVEILKEDYERLLKRFENELQ